MKIRRVHILCLALSAIFYTAVAWFATGYVHADEHFQIIEFANYKAGESTPNDMAWEFREQLRPTLQPTIAYLVFTVSEIFTSSPYTKAFILRLLTVIFGLLVLYHFVKATLSSINDKFKIAYIACSYFLWFIPLIFSRFSSESWSSFFLMLSVIIILKNSKIYARQAFYLGLLFGVAFLFRYQTAIVSLSLLAYLFVIKREHLKLLVQIISGGLLVVILGALVDVWFYNDLAITAWNYFKFNIVDSGASSFGTKPFVWYTYAVIKYSLIPIGILITLAAIYFLLDKRYSIYVWICAPFVLIHSLIPHKETRFLFPIAFTVVPMVFIFLQDHYNKAQNYLPKLKSYLPYILIISVSLPIIFNAIGLSILVSKTAGSQVIPVGQYIYKNYKNQQVYIYHTPKAAPYAPFHVPMKFYDIERAYSFEIASLCNLDVSKIDHDKNNLLTISTLDEPDWSCLNNHKDLKFTKLLQSRPEWLVKLYSIYPDIEYIEQVYLYKIELKS